MSVNACRDKFMKWGWGGFKIERGPGQGISLSFFLQFPRSFSGIWGKVKLYFLAKENKKGYKFNVFFAL